MSKRKRRKSAKLRRRTDAAPPRPGAQPATWQPETATPWRPAGASYLLMGAIAASTAMATPAPAQTGARSGPRPHLGGAAIIGTYDAAEQPSLDAWTWGDGGGGAASSGAASNGAAAGATPAASVRFDIPAGNLAAALAAFATQSGVRVELTDATLGELPSAGVAGEHTADAALTALLAGTGAEPHRRDDGSILVAAVTVRGEVEVVERARLQSPKQLAPLVDTPQSITVINAELIQAQSAASLRDVLRNVTGISIQAGEGGGGLPGDNLAIRGFAARNDIFVDGVRDFGAYSRDPYNVEQVEVSKGPASVFAGRGSTGGAVNLATKLPTLAPALDATVAIGTDDFRRGTVDLDRTLDSDRLAGGAFRINAMYTAGDTPGRDEVNNERFGVAPSLALGLEGPTRLWLSGSYQQEDNLPEYGLPWVPNTNQPLADHADQPAPVDFDNFYGLVDRDYEKTDTALATATVERSLAPNAILRGLVRGGRSQRDSVITAPRFASTTGTDLNRQLQARDLDDRILDAQVDVDLGLATGGVDHTIVAGVEVARETADNRPRTGPTAPLADLFDPDPHAPYAGPIVHTGARTENRADTAAAYVFDTLHVGERLEVMAGARYDRFEVDFDNRAAAGTTTVLGRQDEMVSWRSGVVYKPHRDGTVYAAVGTSFNPAAEGNTGLSLTTATVLLEPEKSRSAEVGTKWELANHRLLATAALFETEKTNARTPGIDPGDPPTMLEGRQRVRGFEVGLNGRPADGWLAFAGYTYLDSEILESNTPDEIGRELANTPRHSFSTWVSYRFPWGLELGGGAQFVDDRFNNTSNVRVAPAYWKLDATVAYAVNERLSLRLNADNLADERYIDRVGGGHFIPGPGRSVALTTAIGF